jgi:ABC-type antimicrobial peptide transport system permease subunit
VNQTAARELFGAADPIGRRIREGEKNYTVVGVTRDVQSGFLTTKPVATLFLPIAADRFRTSPAESCTILVRGTNGPETLAAVRNQLTSLHPDLTVFHVRSMRADLERLNSFVEWDAGIYEVLGLFALLLASVGLGGVTAYAVAQRQKEIGIRMALGARSGQVQALVLREGTVLVVVGTVLGLGGAFALLRAFATFTPIMMKSFGERTNDPWLLFAAPLVLAGLAMLACYLPARRATKIDPMSALRAE